MVSAMRARLAQAGHGGRSWGAATMAICLAVLLTCGCRASAGSSRQAPPGAAAPSAAPQPREQVRPALWPDENVLSRVSPTLLEQLRSDPYVYFRFVNRQWTRRVCQQFTDQIPDLLSVRLHGDAHLAQYAYTETERGLDDFDDSAIGPAVVDISRFLASVDLVLRRHDWSDAYPAAADAFLTGYRQGLTTGAYLPPDPAVVVRLRQRPRRDTAAFLQWVDSLMVPLPDEVERLLPLVEGAIDQEQRRRRPSLPPDYFRTKRAGLLNLGVGSAVTAKVLFRMEGPTAAADDDLVIEAKRASDLTDVPCLTVPSVAEAARVVDGAAQIGRLRNEVLMLLPKLGPAGFGAWWVRTWSPSYTEVEVDDYVSASEIVEVAHDVGAQLGSRNLASGGPDAEARGRRLEGQAVDQMERRIRDGVAHLTAELLDAWDRFRRRPSQ